MTNPKSEKRASRDSSRSGMASQHPTQQSQQGHKQSPQQGDTMDPSHRGGHRPQGGDAGFGSEPRQQDSRKRS